MANEATIALNLKIRVGNQNYQSNPTQFQADITNGKGPVPGAITVSVVGTDIDLSELADPGLCWLHNLDDTNYVTYGIRDPQTAKFYPLGELLPNELSLFRLSRQLGEEYDEGESGTGTVEIKNVLHFRADTDSVDVRIEAFDN